MEESLPVGVYGGSAVTTIQHTFLSFIRQRDVLRVYKDFNFPKPWTEDHILANYRFCNVNREHDTVTVWVKDNLRNRYAGCGIQFMVVNLLIARIFNEPTVLSKLIPLHAGPQAFLTAERTLADLQKTGKIMRGAYMMPAHGTAGKGMNIGDYWMRTIEEASRMDYRSCTCLEAVANRLCQVTGLGDFLANQVCTDLRYVPGFKWVDWDTFIRCGPGTRRGLDRWHGREPEGTLCQFQYQKDLLEVRDEISGDIPVPFITWFRDPNNLSNCFCEFDKYMRARGQREQGKSITLRKYGTT